MEHTLQLLIYSLLEQFLNIYYHSTNKTVLSAKAVQKKQFKFINFLLIRMIFITTITFSFTLIGIDKKYSKITLRKYYCLSLLSE